MRLARDKLMGGSFESIIVPDTPSAILVGELCVDHGYSFDWYTGKTPYPLLPNGMRLDLTIEGNTPYLTMGAAKGHWVG